MKKFVSLMLALAMLMSLFACGNGDSAASNPPEGSKEPGNETQLGEFVPYTYDDESVYMAAMGDYYEALLKAKESDDVDETFALMALAEGKLMETGTLQIWKGDGGGYTMNRIVDKSKPTVLWGSDSDRYENAIVTEEILKGEDRDALLALWSEKAGTGEYEQAAKDYLTGAGYTLKHEMGYWDYAADPETWDVLTAWTNTVSRPLCHVVEGLVKYDMENEIQPALAESWEEGTGTLMVAQRDEEGNVVEDEDGNPVMEEQTFTTWTFHIREGLIWTDSQGRRLDDIKADDWVASMQHVMDYFGESSAEVAAPIIVNGTAYCEGEITDFSEVGVKAVDDHTLVYYLTRPVPTFESMLTYCGLFSPLCRSYYVSQGGTFGVDTHDNGTYGSSPDNIGYCGPYLIKSYTPLNSIIYEENPSYWNAGNLNITRLVWPYNDGKDALKAYDDFLNGIIDRCGLGPTPLQKCREDGNFDPYVRTIELEGTTRIGFTNLNRQMFHLYNDANACLSPQSHESADSIDRFNGVVTSDILDDAARTHSAMNNLNFRLALSFGWDRASFNAQFVGEELKELSLRNTYVPGNFVALGKDVTVDINGTPTTFPAGTYYGEIAQAQIDADGYPIKVWDPEANGGLGSGDGFDGYYNVDNAREYLAKAAEELAAVGVEVSKENPIQIDYYYGAHAERFVNRAQAYKQSIESSLEGMVIVNLVACADQQQLNATNFLNPTGAEDCVDVAIGTGWSADYEDPASYLDNLLPFGNGYQCKNLGVW